MAWVAIAMAVVSAVSALKKGQADQASAESAAQASQYNATVANQRADNTLLIANQNEEAQRRKARQIIGNQRAGLAESGIDMTSGTGLDLVTQSYTNAELDSQNIRYEGQLNAKGLRDQATLFDYDAQVARMNGKSAVQSSYLQAGASALSGYGRYQYAQGRTSGYGGLTT
jgi:hypothetical protein